MSGGLFALLDDISVLARAAAASIDDVAGQAAKAGAKAAGAVIDDALGDEVAALTFVPGSGGGGAFRPKRAASTEPSSDVDDDRPSFDRCCCDARGTICLRWSRSRRKSRNGSAGSCCGVDDMDAGALHVAFTSARASAMGSGGMLGAVRTDSASSRSGEAGASSDAICTLAPRSDEHRDLSRSNDILSSRSSFKSLSHRRLLIGHDLRS